MWPLGDADAHQLALLAPQVDAEVLVAVQAGRQADGSGVQRPMGRGGHLLLAFDQVQDDVALGSLGVIGLDAGRRRARVGALEDHDGVVDVDDAGHQADVGVEGHGRVGIVRRLAGGDVRTRRPVHVDGDGRVRDEGEGEAQTQRQHGEGPAHLSFSSRGSSLMKLGPYPSLKNLAVHTILLFLRNVNFFPGKRRCDIQSKSGSSIVPAPTVFFSDF